MFYNLVAPSEISKSTRPNDTNEVLWAQAVANNPDPSRYARSLAPTRIHKQTNPRSMLML